jgi:FG-GAP-like repeat
MANINFAPPSNFVIDYRPGSAVDAVGLGDFNNDGKLDLVTTTYSGDNILIALGNGSGGFSSATNFAVGVSPKSIGVGYIDGDGNLDLVTSNYVGSNQGSLSVLFGNGSGGFSVATNIPSVGDLPISVQVADFNGDGKPDLATANYFSNNVSIVINNGNRTFATPIKIAVGTGPSSMRLGDFNGDGTVDLITANVSSNNVSVLLGNGNGTFNPALNSPTGTSQPRYVSVGDFNSDSRLDLAIANGSNNNVSISLGNLSCYP